MAIYCDIDLHLRQHSLSYCDAADDEVRYQEFHHERDDLTGFYSRLTSGVIVVTEARGYSAWFEQLLASFSHDVWRGDTAERCRRAKRRQKNDRRDAELILDRLLWGEYPRVHCPPPESRKVLLRYSTGVRRARSCNKATPAG